MNAVTAAVRHYVVRVVGNTDPDNEASQKLADDLLRPLSEWESARRAVAGESGSPPATGAPVPAGAGPGAPVPVPSK